MTHIFCFMTYRTLLMFLKVLRQQSIPKLVFAWVLFCLWVCPLQGHLYWVVTYLGREGWKGLGSTLSWAKLIKGFLGAFILAGLLVGILPFTIHLWVSLRIHFWIFLLGFFWSLLAPSANHRDRFVEVWARNFNYIVCARVAARDIQG